jgi:type IV pilus assembly protein PilX
MKIHRHCHRRQQGIVLYLALIILVAMTLAASALIRSVDTGTLVAGNLAFKQGATLAADGGGEAAIAYLTPLAGSSTLFTDQVSAGYYATFQSSLDLTGNSNDSLRARVDWDGNGCAGVTTPQCIAPAPALAIDAGGNTVRYIIHRLCDLPGSSNASDNSCVTYKSGSIDSPKKGDLKVGDDKRFESLPTVYYRVTTRVKGPRNTVSFVETMLHF